MCYTKDNKEWVIMFAVNLGEGLIVKMFINIQSIIFQRRLFQLKNNH